MTTTKRKLHMQTHDSDNSSSDAIIRYEQGEMTLEEEVTLFQKMIDTGEVWQFQGNYGRRAMELLEAGYCILGEQGHRDYYGNYVPSRHEVKPGTKGSKVYSEQKQRERERAV